MCLHTRCLFPCSFMSLSCYPVYFFELFWTITFFFKWLADVVDLMSMASIYKPESSAEENKEKIPKNQNHKRQTRKQRKTKPRSKSLPLCSLLSPAPAIWLNFTVSFNTYKSSAHLRPDLQQLFLLPTCSKIYCLVLSDDMKQCQQFLQCYLYVIKQHLSHTEQKFVALSWIFLTCKVYWKHTCLTTELLGGSLSKGILDKPTFKSAGKRNLILYCRTLQYHLL